MNIKQTYGLQLKTYLIDLILNWQSEGREKISVSEITDHFIERQKKESNLSGARKPQEAD
jgi:hypothetical protein